MGLHPGIRESRRSDLDAEAGKLTSTVEKQRLNRADRLFSNQQLLYGVLGIPCIQGD